METGGGVQAAVRTGERLPEKILGPLGPTSFGLSHPKRTPLIFAPTPASPVFFILCNKKPLREERQWLWFVWGRNFFNFGKSPA